MYQSPISPLAYVKRNPVSIFLSPVTESEILKIINELKLSKQGISEIPVKLFKEISLYIIPALRLIINDCFSEGVYPECLKQASIIPIFKSGDPLSIENYRPISILPFFNKIFETTIYNRINDFVSKCKLISPEQFGFQKNRSTEQAITCFSENIYDTLNKKESAISVFIDFSKAFETVNHSILLDKLEAYGIRGIALDLISSYLSNRRHVTRIGGHVSSPKVVNISVPQGSNLGPIFFILYVNDLLNISSLFSSILFADDLTLNFRHSNLETLVRNCNSEIQKLIEWTQCNRLTINHSKSFFMFISNRFRYYHPLILLNNAPLKQCMSGKFLGVIVDDSLNFKLHIDYISNKVSKSIGILFKLKDYLPQSTLVSLYYSFIYPYLIYCNLVWGGTYSSHLGKLIKLQKKRLEL